MSQSEGPTAILVVDDEQAILSALKKFLTVKGYDVSTAASGEEALDVLRRLKIAGLVLDVRMPGLSGIDLVPKVLEIEPNAAILMLTAVNDATTASLCMQRGAMEYLTKPIDRDLLRQALLRYRRIDEDSTVLLVEDDPETREIIARTLEQATWKVTEAALVFISLSAISPPYTAVGPNEERRPIFVRPTRN